MQVIDIKRLANTGDVSKIVLHSCDILESVLFCITCACAFVLASGGVEVIREGCSDVLCIDVGILTRSGNGIIARPAFTEIAKDVVGKEGCGEVAVEESFLHTGVDVELVGIVVKAVVVAGGIVQIEHRLRGLVDGEPVAEVYLPFRVVAFRGEAVCLCVEVLLPVTEGQRGVVETELGRGCQRGVVTLELVEIAVGPDGDLRSLLIQTAKVQTHIFTVAIPCREAQP